MTEKEIEKQAEEYLIKFLHKNNIVGILSIKTAWDLRCILIDVIKYVLSEGRKELEKENAELKKNCEDLKEFYEKEYFEIADKTANERIKELEQYETEITVDDYSPYDENTWGMMHEEMFVPKNVVIDMLKEIYAYIENIKKENEELKKQNEKLKCCGNCKKYLSICRCNECLENAHKYWEFAE